MNNEPILLTDKITRTRYRRVGSDWSDTRWASWGLAGLILASLVVFGVLGCQKTYPVTPIIAPHVPVVERKHVTSACDQGHYNCEWTAMICDDAGPVKNCRAIPIDASTYHAN